MSEVQPSVEDRISAHLYGPPEETAEPATPPEPAKEPPAEEPTPLAAEQPDEPEKAAEPSNEPDEEVLEVDSLAGLAEHFGLEPADLYNLRVPIELEDGEHGEFTLSELKDGFRARQVSEAAAKKATQQREAFEARQAEVEKVEKQWEARMQETAATLQVAEQHLAHEFNAIDWANLQSEDPGDYAAKRLAFNERHAALEGAKRQLVQSWASAKEEQEQQAEQHRAEALEREQAAMLKAIPEWRDEDAAKLERAELATYLETHGFGTDEVAGIADHRHIVLARKAMLYDKHVKAADATKKRVVRLSSKKPLQPNARQTQEERQAETESAARSRLRKTGHINDAVEVIGARLRRSDQQ